MKNILNSFPIPIRYVFALAFVLSVIIYLQILLSHIIWGEPNEYIWYQTVTPIFVNFLIWAVLSPFIYSCEPYACIRIQSIHPDFANA
jgi:hypothetical protein